MHPTKESTFFVTVPNEAKHCEECSFLVLGGRWLVAGIKFQHFPIKTAISSHFHLLKKTKNYA